MDESTTRVIADLDRYEQLITAETTLDNLTQVLFENAELNWKHDDLDFDVSQIRAMLKGVYPAWYSNKLKKLKQELETQDKTAK